MNQINICSKRSGDMEDGAFRVTNAIKSTTKPHEFDNIIAGIPGYKLENGGRCGWNALGAAALKGNIELNCHIVKIGGHHLLSLGNGNGWTPLYCAAYCENTEVGFLAAKELMRLGSDVNLATSCWSGDSLRGDTPRGATPLWVAAQKTKNLKVIKLLLKNGAIIPPKLDPQAQTLVDGVQKEIEDEKKPGSLLLAAWLKPENQASIIQILPKELLTHIFEITSFDPEYAIK
jgi:hypothetical protein